MPDSSILGGDRPQPRAAGRDTGALGPSDSSDSGSDIQGETPMATGADQADELGGVPVDTESDSDRNGTGERGSATGDMIDDADIRPDRITRDPTLSDAAQGDDAAADDASATDSADSDDLAASDAALDAASDAEPPDDPTNERIDVDDDQALAEWAEKLDTTPEQLKEAVDTVGDLAADVEMHLKGSHSTTNADRIKDAGDT